MTTVPDDIAFELLETMHLQEGTYQLLAEHLQRLRASAGFFAVPLDGAAVSAALQAMAESRSGGSWRVRLLLSRAGNLRLEAEPLQPLPAGPLPVELASQPVHRDNPFLYHKTTRREFFAQQRAEHPHAFDVLLWNEDGELTEFTMGNLVVELDGLLLTPFRTAGLLAGTFRAHLLAQKQIAEARLTREDLDKAAWLWFINSVRGWVPVRLAGG